MNDEQDTPVKQPPEDRSEVHLERLRLDIAERIKTTFPWLFIMTVAVAAVLILLVLLGFFLGRTMDTAVLAASVQIAFGMVIGFFCVYIGLMMTWFGIDAAYTFKGSAGGAEGALKSASPGLLFALAGVVLIAVSLHKRIDYQENNTSFGDSIEIEMPDPPDKITVGPEE